MALGQHAPYISNRHEALAAPPANGLSPRGHWIAPPSERCCQGDLQRGAHDMYAHHTPCSQGPWPRSDCCLASLIR
jgi:hypothetical protein